MRLQAALEEFRVDMNRYPTESEGLEALVSQPKNGRDWRGAYVQKKYLKDPWQRPYRYQITDGKPKLYSKGETGKELIDLEGLLDEDENRKKTKKSSPPIQVITFDFPPAGYVEACSEHRQLLDSGLSVKADRHAEAYRNKYIYPTFLLTPGDRISLRLRSKTGFRTAPVNDGNYSFDDSVKSDSTEGTTGEPNEGVRFRIFNVRIPDDKLEPWQDFVRKYFYRAADAEESEVKETAALAEIVLDINSKGMISRRSSIVSDCFDSDTRGPEISLFTASDGILLRSYRMKR